MKESSYEGDTPNKEPQAPRSISIETADRDTNIGRNNAPYNRGGEGHESSRENPPGAK